MSELIPKNQSIGNSYKLIKGKVGKISKLADKIMEDSNAKRLKRKKEAEERVNRKVPREPNPAAIQLKQAKGRNGIKINN